MVARPVARESETYQFAVLRLSIIFERNWGMRQGIIVGTSRINAFHVHD